MKPTAYVLLAIAVALAITSALVFRTASPYAPAGAGAAGGPPGPSPLMIILLVGAAGAAVLAWTLLRYGGKGYTVTATPPRG